MNAAVNQAVRDLRKISPKTVLEACGEDINTIGNVRPIASRVLYDVFGVVNGATVGQTEKGPWVKFKGRFQAVTPDGREFESGAMHIPKPMEDMLHSSLNEAKSRDDRAQVHVALRIAIEPAKPGKPSATGYEYNVQRLIKDETPDNDPIKLLRARASESQLALTHAPAVASNAAESAPAAAESAPAAAESAPATSGHGRHGGKK